VSPTALSHSSRSTEQTDAAGDSVDPTESTSEGAALPSNVKKLQTNTVLPAVVDEDDFDDEDLAESDIELPAEKDEEFHSVSGDIDEQPEEQPENQHEEPEEQPKDENTFQTLATDFQASADNIGSQDVEKLLNPESSPVSPESIEKSEAEDNAEKEIDLNSETESLKLDALEAAAKTLVGPKSDDFDVNKTISEDESHDMVNINALNAQAA